MKPTAPPVKRGSPCTNGARNSAMSAPHDRHERLGRLGRDARAIHDRLAVARAQDQERVLAEEGIARDLLAAFHALEQERVVGVLGNLEKGGHRRQQVRHDLLHDRHERAAPRQLHELVERRLFHATDPSCCLATDVHGLHGSGSHGSSIAPPPRTGPRAAAGRSRSRTDVRPARRASPGRRWRAPGAPPRRASGSSDRGRRRGRRRAGRRRRRRMASRPERRGCRRAWR